jgi:C1A family cysteine protease
VKKEVKSVLADLPPPLSKIGRKYHLRKSTVPHNLPKYVAATAVADLPSSVDLSPMTLPALDQENCGSCSANSAAAILRFLVRKEEGRTAPFTTGDWLPSRLFLYYNTRVKIEGTAPSEDSGCVLTDVPLALAQYHDCTEYYWPYDTTKFSVPPSAISVAHAQNHKQLQYEVLDQNLDDFRACLAEGYCIQVGIQVFESFESAEVAQTGIVPMPLSTEQCLGGHALVVVSYHDNTQMFGVQNSWGSSNQGQPGGWGYNNSGLCFIPYSYIMDPNIGSTESIKYSFFE